MSRGEAPFRRPDPLRGLVSRRNLLRGGLLGAGGAAAFIAHRALQPLEGSDDSVAVQVRATPLAGFSKADPSAWRFGDLAFRAGLVLSSDDPGFGGLSGLWRSPDGGRLVAVSDHAQWLTARVDRAEGRLAGLSEVRLAPVLGQDGVPLRRGPAYDTEALAIADGVAFLGIERVHEVRRFEWAREGVLARGVPIPMPPEVKDLPSNGSLEAVAVAPPGHPLAGAVIAIAEEASSGAEAPTLGWVLTGPQRFRFEVARSEDFDVTDAAFLPSGELLILERRYAVTSGVACRVRRVAVDAIRPGALVDGRVVFQADRSFEIDNMEGLAIHRDPATGQTILTLVSDDNFSRAQRTLLLEFALAG